ncbi:hypothetical protein L9Z17_07095 [Leptospira noguchii]|uniref:hypothetical protein n=1 Tax=Leptospira noguchii TaxID=28182 RepID=UPI001F060ABE|nr:hypothetical protein [Leptospira noguchii]MCH1911687.1 hypothetical protein [Leptospira noguchii]UOG64695.1 hypothetical protein MAL04_03820 [Leptospira noguchii]
MSRSAERSLWIAFYIKTKEYYYINFSVCNLLTEPGPAACGKPDIHQDFLMSNSR